MTRISFAVSYALRHLVISAVIAAISAVVVFGVWYPMPYRDMLGVADMYFLILGVDVVCGPLLTLVLASPKKSFRERVLDFSLVGVLQIIALVYGMHSVWIARPAVLAFEVDRLVVVTANEIETPLLEKAPEGLRTLPFWGMLQVATKRPDSNSDFFQSVELGLAGISPAMRPNLWETMDMQKEEMRRRAKPLDELIARRPQDAKTLRDAGQKTGRPMSELTYLPLTSSKSKDWIALFDSGFKMVGHAPVDGF